jgi:hypothetical protein
MSHRAAPVGALARRWSRALLQRTESFGLRALTALWVGRDVRARAGPVPSAGSTPPSATRCAILSRRLNAGVRRPFALRKRDGAVMRKVVGQSRSKGGSIKPTEAVGPRAGRGCCAMLVDRSDARVQPQAL